MWIVFNSRLHSQWRYQLQLQLSSLLLDDGQGGNIPITGSFGLAQLQAGDTLELLVDRAM